MLYIAPKLESLVVYDCPNLQKLSFREVPEKNQGNYRREGMVGCVDMVRTRVPRDRIAYLASVFIPIGTYGDIIDAMNLLPRLSVSTTGIGELTKEAGTMQVDEYPGDVVAGPRDKGKGKV